MRESMSPVLVISFLDCLTSLIFANSVKYLDNILGQLMAVSSKVSSVKLPQGLFIAS